VNLLFCPDLVWFVCQIPNALVHLKKKEKDIDTETDFFFSGRRDMLNCQLVELHRDHFHIPFLFSSPLPIIFSSFFFLIFQLIKKAFEVMHNKHTQAYIRNSRRDKMIVPQPGNAFIHFMNIY
jgi:hypothetical protein